MIIVNIFTEDDLYLERSTVVICAIGQKHCKLASHDLNYLCNYALGALIVKFT